MKKFMEKDIEQMIREIISEPGKRYFMHNTGEGVEIFDTKKGVLTRSELKNNKKEERYRIGLDGALSTMREEGMNETDVQKEWNFS